jgi:hypothetical protein
VPLVNARERTGGITELGMVERRCKPRVASGDTAIQKGRKETLHERHIELNSQYKRDRAEKVATSVPNVKQVVNNLQVKNQKASSSR